MTDNNNDYKNTKLLKCANCKNYFVTEIITYNKTNQYMIKNNPKYEIFTKTKTIKKPKNKKCNFCLTSQKVIKGLNKILIGV